MHAWYGLCLLGTLPPHSVCPIVAHRLQHCNPTGLVDIVPSLLAFQPQRYGLPPFDDLVDGTIPMLVSCQSQRAAGVHLSVYVRMQARACHLGMLRVKD